MSKKKSKQKYDDYSIINIVENDKNNYNNTEEMDWKSYCSNAQTIDKNVSYEIKSIFEQEKSKKIKVDDSHISNDQENIKIFNEDLPLEKILNITDSLNNISQKRYEEHLKKNLKDESNASNELKEKLKKYFNNTEKDKLVNKKINSLEEINIEQNQQKDIQSTTFEMKEKNDLSEIKKYKNVKDKSFEKKNEYNCVRDICNTEENLFENSKNFKKSLNTTENIFQKNIDINERLFESKNEYDCVKDNLNKNEKPFESQNGYDCVKDNLNKNEKLFESKNEYDCVKDNLNSNEKLFKAYSDVTEKSFKNKTDLNNVKENLSKINKSFEKYTDIKDDKKRIFSTNKASNSFEKNDEKKNFLTENLETLHEKTLEVKDGNTGIIKNLKNIIDQNDIFKSEKKNLDVYHQNNIFIDKIKKEVDNVEIKTSKAYNNEKDIIKHLEDVILLHNQKEKNMREAINELNSKLLTKEHEIILLKQKLDLFSASSNQDYIEKRIERANEIAKKLDEEFKLKEKAFQNRLNEEIERVNDYKKETSDLKRIVNELVKKIKKIKHKSESKF